MGNTSPVLEALLARGDKISSYTPTLRERVVNALATNWFGDTRDGVQQAKNLSNVLETVTPYGAATMAYDAGRAGGSGDYLGAGLMGAMSVLPLPAPMEQEAKQGIRAFHSSPHSFDKFSMDKVGTGEGAQAYGHGLYAAESEKVSGYGGQYWSQFANQMAQERTPEGIATFALKTANGDRKEAASYLQTLMAKSDGNSPVGKHGQAALDMLNNGGHVGPWTYEVRINANPDDFLDWDKPLSEQPEAIRRQLGWTPEAEAQYNSVLASDTDNLLNALLGDAEYTAQRPPVPQGLPPLSATGADIVKGNSVFDRASDAAKSQALKDKGIPGIKYLDAGSRGKGDGSRNYVVFDDKLIEIVKKYGIAGASALLGMDVMSNMNDAQAQSLKHADAAAQFHKFLQGSQ